MLTQAQKQEWEALTEAQARRAQLLLSLPGQASDLSPSAGKEIASTIRQIQEIDREILSYVEPWREDAAKLLSRLELPASKQA